MSAIPKQHTFSVATAINPLTVPEGEKDRTKGQPFGDDYKGSFTVRRPSLLDKQTIAIRKSAMLSMYGPANPELIKDSIMLTIHTFAFIMTVTTEALPEWFDPNKLYSDTDECAVLAVWEEVSRWLKETFPA
jgi:hypothetical protein